MALCLVDVKARMVVCVENCVVGLSSKAKIVIKSQTFLRLAFQSDSCCFV